jgi:hypothetical protein
VTEHAASHIAHIFFTQADVFTAFKGSSADGKLQKCVPQSVIRLMQIMRERWKRDVSKFESQAAELYVPQLERYAIARLMHSRMHSQWVPELINQLGVEVAGLI